MTKHTERKRVGKTEQRIIAKINKQRTKYRSIPKRLKQVKHVQKVSNGEIKKSNKRLTISKRIRDDEHFLIEKTENMEKQKKGKQHFTHQKHDAFRQKVCRPTQ